MLTGSAEDLLSGVEENDGKHYDELPPWGLESDLLIQIVWSWGLLCSPAPVLTGLTRGVYGSPAGADRRSR